MWFTSYIVLVSVTTKYSRSGPYIGGFVSEVVELFGVIAGKLCE